MDLYLQVQEPTLAPYPTHGWGTTLTKNSVGDGFVGCLDRFYFLGLGLTGVTPFLVLASARLSPQLRFHKRRTCFIRSADISLRGHRDSIRPAKSVV